jgi:hypothetical protein
MSTQTPEPEQSQDPQAPQENPVEDAARRRREDQDRQERDRQRQQGERK